MRPTAVSQVLEALGKLAFGLALAARACRIGVRKTGAKPAETPKDEAPEDPLAAFLRHGQELGAQIRIKD